MLAKGGLPPKAPVIFEDLIANRADEIAQIMLEGGAATVRGRAHGACGRTLVRDLFWLGSWVGRPDTLSPKQVPHKRSFRWNTALRSEERRVGKECRSRWSPD